MKKLHFSLLAILFALFAMVSFTACSSDDDDTPSTEDVQTNIYGMWQVTHISGYWWDEDDKPTKVNMDISLEDAEAYEFKSGGILNEYYWSNNQWRIDSSNEKFSLSGTKLTTYESNGEVLDVYNVQSINANQMILNGTLDGDSSLPCTITFKKIK